MNRALQWINLFGVLIVATLCVVQWRENQRLHLEAAKLDTIRQEQDVKLAALARTMQGSLADLEEMRNRRTLIESELKKAQGALSAMTLDRDRLTAERERLAEERDQLATSLNDWKAAVTSRDDLIKKADDAIHLLLDQRDAAVASFNGLANQYNAVVKDLNAERRGSTTTRAADSP